MLQLCMNEIPEPFSIDYEELKRRITDEVRAVIRERADELGISYEECAELLLGKADAPEEK
jgi:hypothetical protein